MELLISIVMGIIGSLAAAQFYDCSPRLSQWIIQKSAARLSPKLSERFGEEWLAHLEECDGKLTMLWHAAECVIASHRIRPPYVQEAHVMYVYYMARYRSISMDRSVLIQTRKVERYVANLRVMVSDGSITEQDFDMLVSDLKANYDLMLEENRARIRENDRLVEVYRLWRRSRRR